MYFLSSVLLVSASVIVSSGFSDRSRVIFRSNVPHSMNRYRVPGAPQPPEFRLSSFELNLVNEALVDIMVSKCPSVQAEEADGLKSYISEQIAKAPKQSSMNTGFIEAYGNLIKCLEMTEQDRINAGQGVKLENGLKEVISEPKDLPFTSSILPIQNNNDPMSINSEPILTNDNQQAVEETKEEQLKPQSRNLANLPIPTPTEPLSLLNTIPDSGHGSILKNEVVTIKSIEPSKTVSAESTEKPGLLDTVGHLFSNLYENTIRIFSWFGRKKRQSDYEDKKHISTLRRNMIKEIQRHRENRILNKYRQNRKSTLNNLSHKKGPGSMLGAKIHFNEILDGMRFIAHKSCPARLGPVNDFVNEAVKEVLWYIYKDLNNVEAEGQKLAVNQDLQKRVQRCVKAKDLGV